MVILESRRTHGDKDDETRARPDQGPGGLLLYR